MLEQQGRMNCDLTIPQAMDALDVSERRIREWIAQGHVTSLWINGVEVIPRDSLLDFQGRLADEAFAAAEEQEQRELEQYAKGVTLRTLHGMQETTYPSVGCLGFLLAPILFLIGTLVNWMIDGIAWLVRVIWRGLRNILPER
jgi:hypothetical protein